MENIEKHYIIGLGTGRSGTKTLAKFLNKCKCTSVSHEFRGRHKAPHRLAWYFKKKEADERLAYLRRIPHLFVGDIASYYLNYIDYFIKELSNVKFIYLYRNIDEVVKSFMKVTHYKVRPDANHWFSHTHEDFKNGKYSKMKWDRCFPKFRKVNSKRNAIYRYCELYEKKMKKMRKKYSGKIFPVYLEFLNDKTIQKAMFDFLEIPESFRKYQLNIENKGKVSHANK